jgi:hypothetical protein
MTGKHWSNDEIALARQMLSARAGARLSLMRGFAVIRLRVAARSTKGRCSLPPRPLQKAAPIQERHTGGAGGEGRGVGNSAGRCHPRLEPSSASSPGGRWQDASRRVRCATTSARSRLAQRGRENAHRRIKG